MRRSDFDSLTLGELWHGARLLSLLIAAYRSGEKNQTDRAVSNFVGRIEESEAWLREHGLLYGQVKA